MANAENSSAEKENIETYTKEELTKKKCGELKQILRSHGKTVGGNKDLLISRILAVVAERINRPDGNGGRHVCVDYEPVRPDKWTRKLDAVPELSEQRVTDYFMKEVDNQDMVARGDRFNLVKANSLLMSGHVQDLSIAKTDEHVLCQAAVKPTMKQKAYRTRVAFNTNGEIACCTCTCVAGKGESCCHVGAVLLLLVHLQKMKVQDLASLTSCTSQLARWVIPSQVGKHRPVPMKEVQIVAPVLGKVPEIKKHQQDPVFAVNINKWDQERKQEFANEYAKVVGDCPFVRYNLKKKSEQVPPKSSVSTSDDTCEHVEGMIEDELQSVQEDMSLIEQCMAKEPMDCTKEELCDSICNYSKKHKQRIERETRKQDNKVWMEERHIRVTASNFGKVNSYRGDKFPLSAVKSCLGYYKQGYVKALEYGKKMESVACMAYMEKTKTKVECSGLVISDAQPYLAASPDGIVTDGGQSIGLVEIKCPQSMAGQSVQSIIEGQLLGFCQYSDGKMSLKKGHAYYSQVQGQLAIAHHSWCDFVIYTGHKSDGLHIERINFDEEHWEALSNKLSAFYVDYILPEIISRDIMPA